MIVQKCNAQLFLHIKALSHEKLRMKICCLKYNLEMFDKIKQTRAKMSLIIQPFLGATIEKFYIP